MKDIQCPYTEEMIASENKFLENLEQFSRPQEQLNLKSSNIASTPIGTLVPLTLGANKGEMVPIELKDRLEKGFSKDIKELDLTKPDYETDVIVVRKRWCWFMCSH